MTSPGTASHRRRAQHVAAVVAAALVLGAAPAAGALAPAPATARLCPTGPDVCALIVEVEAGSTGSVLADVLAEVVDEGALGEAVAPGAVGVRTDHDRAPDLLRALAREPGVVDVRVDPLLETTALPDDPSLGQQRQYLDAVRLPQLWDGGRADGQLVAVVDSGVDETHPDLQGRVVDRYDAVTGAASAVDVDGHGTAVASVAAAGTDDGVQMAGSGWGASLLAVKVDDASGRIYLSAVSRAVRWSADRGADVINLSLGGPVGDPLLQEAVEYADSSGALVVAAAGNDGTTAPSYPAAYPSVLSVGSTTRDGTGRSSFSQYGGWVDVAAPGEALLGADLDGGLDVVSGTSFSSPLVAGGAAVLRATHPGASPQEVAAALQLTAARTPAGFATGLVDLAGASTALVPGGPCLPARVAASVALGADGTAARGWRDPATGGVRVQVVSSDGTRGPVQDLGGAVLGAPSLAWRGDGSLEVAARGTNDLLYVQTLAGSAGSAGWLRIPVRLTARPDLAARPDGGVDVLVRGADGALHLSASPRARSYGAPQVVGGALLAGAGPGASYDGSGRLVVAVIGTDRALWVAVRTGSTFSRWRSGGGVLVGDVDAATPGTAVQVVGLGSNATVYTQGVRPDATGTGWSRVAGLDAVTAPSAAGAGGQGYLTATGRTGWVARSGWDGVRFAGWSTSC